MPITAALFWLVYIYGVVGALFNPLIGVCVYIIIYHVNPETQWWGWSFNAVGLRTSFTIALATMAGIMLQRPKPSHSRRQITTPIFLAGLMLLLAVMSLTWGYGWSDRGSYQLEKFFKILIFLLLLIRCVREPTDYQAVIASWLAGVFYMAYQSWGNVGVFHGGRLTGGLGGPDFAESSGLAVHLSATLPIIGALLFMARRWWMWLLLLFFGALTTNMILLTRSRNAIVAVGAMTAVALASLPRGYRLRGYLGVGVAFVFAMNLADPGWWNRVQTIVNYEHDQSARDRLTYWAAAIEMAEDHPIGIGIGNFHHVVMDYVEGLAIQRSAHNTYMTCLAELGYPGLAVFMLVLVAALLQVSRVRYWSRRFRSEMRVMLWRWPMTFHLGWHAMALRCALIGYLAGAIFTTRLWTEGLWILIALATCLQNVAVGMVVRERRKEVAITPDEATPTAPALAEGQPT